MQGIESYSMQSLHCGCSLATICNCAWQIHPRCVTEQTGTNHETACALQAAVREACDMRMGISSLAQTLTSLMCLEQG